MELIINKVDAYHCTIGQAPVIDRFTRAFQDVMHRDHVTYSGSTPNILERIRAVRYTPFAEHFK